MAVRLNGSTGYERSTVIANMGRSTQMCWFRPRSIPSTQVAPLLGLADSPASNVQERQLYINGGTVGTQGTMGFDISSGGDVRITSTLVLTAGQWHHAAATVDGTTMRLFIDGVQAASIAAGDAYSLYATPGIQVGGALGYRPSGAGQQNYYFDGDIAEVAWWSDALPPGAIAMIAAGDSPSRYLRNKSVIYVPGPAFTGPPMPTVWGNANSIYLQPSGGYWISDDRPPIITVAPLDSPVPLSAPPRVLAGLISLPEVVAV